MITFTKITLIVGVTLNVMLADRFIRRCRASCPDYQIKAFLNGCDCEFLTNLQKECICAALQIQRYRSRLPALRPDAWDLSVL